MDRTREERVAAAVEHCKPSNGRDAVRGPSREEMVKCVSVPGSVRTTTRARPGADQSSTSLPRRRSGKTGVGRESPGVPKRGEAQVQGEAVGERGRPVGEADPESPGFPPRQKGGFPPRLAR